MSVNVTGMLKVFKFLSRSLQSNFSNSAAGDSQAILGVLVNIIRHHVIDIIEDPLHGRIGIELLEYWAQEVVGMSGNLFCSEFVTTHLESYRNLEKLALHLKIELPLNVGNSGMQLFYIYIKV